MAEVAISVDDLTIDTRSDDLVGGGTSVDAADTFTISGFGGDTRDLIIVFEEEGTGAATVTINGGDNPPSMLGDLGNLSVALATSDLRVVVLEPGRYIQSDGTITGSVATNDVFVSVLRVPREA